MTDVEIQEKNQSTDEEDIDQEMSGNVCRCGTYPRIRRGIKRAAAMLAESTISGERSNG